MAISDRQRRSVTAQLPPPTTTTIAIDHHNFNSRICMHNGWFSSELRGCASEKEAAISEQLLLVVHPNAEIS